MINCNRVTNDSIASSKVTFAEHILCKKVIICVETVAAAGTLLAHLSSIFGFDDKIDPLAAGEPVRGGLRILFGRISV